MANSELDSVLDLNTLEQYCSAIGAGTLLRSVVLFEKLLPEYLAKLKAAYDAGDNDVLCSEAHKFKGAAGSVGLKRVHHLAQYLQHGEDPQWAAHHAEWLAEIMKLIEGDLATLKRFLEEKA
ncbi:Hpt domain-containing protein [Shewanella avicenniae]|uniref:Hpt domain-containing protein n=1 Tax=Shewanella avicenniae TaxID=2814294 RepID=A0ABX7QT90_9GAMM|nr:Hpt domain-containing protein [Shewanella avicenniae]QSX34692.1 Hpt domain-containing protein [Shewanella avicenniae]